MRLYCFVSVLSAFFLCNKTKWFSCLHLVGLFPFWCFVLIFCFGVSSFLSKKDKKPDTAKPQNQNAEKKEHCCSGSAVTVVATNLAPIFLGRV